MEEKNKKDKSNGYLFAAVIATAVILIIGLLIPCPSKFQVYIFRLILSVSVGIIAGILPGYFEISYKGLIKATSGVGIMVLFYLINPGELIKDDNCNPTVAIPPAANVDTVIKETAILDTNKPVPSINNSDGAIIQSGNNNVINR